MIWMASFNDTLIKGFILDSVVLKVPLIFQSLVNHIIILNPYYSNEEKKKNKLPLIKL